MTPEEGDRYERIDRTLEFLASNQAQLSAELGKLSAELDKLKEVTGMHSAQIEAQGKQIGELGNFVLRLGHVVEEQVAAQARTDERLNVLITVVERYFSNGRNWSLKLPYGTGAGAALGAYAGRELFKKTITISVIRWGWAVSINVGKSKEPRA